MKLVSIHGYQKPYSSLESKSGARSLKSNVTADYEYICTDYMDNRQREKEKQMYDSTSLEMWVRNSMKIHE